MALPKFLKNKENAFYLNKITKKANKVDELNEHFSKLTDDELQRKTGEFKERLQNGETLDDIMFEAFATVREASARILGMKHYLVQLIGGIALHEGNIAEMRTGEGKTLVGTLPAYLNALTGKGVHIVTVNEYLANRDHDIMAPLYQFLGLTTSVVTSDMSKEEKQEAYSADIVYVTNTEVGFDYLRDNMVLKKDDKVLGELNFCIIDEVDSVLLDDARTPLIISGAGEEPSNMYYLADLFVQDLQKDIDFKVDEESRSVLLNNSGFDKAEMMFGVENLADIENNDLRYFIDKALQAHYMMKKDKDYIIRDNQIMIIDESTGRVAEGRRFSHGLHQALEAKEGVKVQKENQTLATITYQNFFLLYNKLSGMTGTAATNAEEFKDIYNLNIVTIPTNKPIARIDHPDKLYVSEKAKNKAIVADVRACYEKGQPVLIGTSSIEKSETLSRLLDKEDIPHVVLNAKNHRKEAEIIAKAGQKYAVTIATNMAGRGTDIKLGEGVKELGGLKVIGTERASNRRIDNQLIGRSGRQGDPGESQFYLSFDDDLLRIFTPEHIRKRVELLAKDNESPIEMKMLIKGIHSAQERLEGTHFDARKSTIEFDSINNQQRSIVYEQRNQLLEEDFDILNMLKEMTIQTLNEQFEGLLYRFRMEDRNTDEWKKARVELKKFFIRAKIPAIASVDFDDLTSKQIEFVQSHIEETVNKKIEMIQSMELTENFRIMSLEIVDNVWRGHLETLDYLKESVKFAGFKQAKPIDEYSKLAFEAFEQAMNDIRVTISERVLGIDCESFIEEAV